MNVLLNVMDSLKKFGFSIILGMSMGGELMGKKSQWGPMVGTPSTPEKGCG
jgi:hypothetical protein